jgi:ubiquinone/menaquinone biosynthesis C-methylase UbiE
MDIASTARRKGDRGVVMEGLLADWYAKTTARDLSDFEAQARRIAARLAPGSRVLEIAPGPGYLAIAIARAGRFQIDGVDISRSFVRMATENAARAGVEVTFSHGDASDIPFPENTFDFIVCRAAFKNFADPVGALREMRRVLKGGGEALIIDLRKDASRAAIDARVADMNLGWLDSLFTKVIFRTVLCPRAYAPSDFQRMAAATPFGEAKIDEETIGLEVWLRK